LAAAVPNFLWAKKTRQTAGRHPCLLLAPPIYHLSPYISGGPPTRFLSMSTTISKNGHEVTLINVFTVDPAKQQALIDLLVRATETIMHHLPGFISANIHRGLDGTKVANYAQWASIEDFQAMQKNPAAVAHMKEASALAQSFEPSLYVVAEVSTTEPEFVGVEVEP
jgi:heme-degrading monooxygenase HmoA